MKRSRDREKPSVKIKSFSVVDDDEQRFNHFDMLGFDDIDKRVEICGCD